VVCAYPISPQTHRGGVEHAGESGRLTPCEFINVESEHAELPSRLVCTGSSTVPAAAWRSRWFPRVAWLRGSAAAASGRGHRL
jgi:hypothetical protein